jgi:hypothetical protein
MKALYILKEIYTYHKERDDWLSNFTTLYESLQKSQSIHEYLTYLGLVNRKETIGYYGHQGLYVRKSPNVSDTQNAGIWVIPRIIVMSLKEGKESLYWNGEKRCRCSKYSRDPQFFEYLHGGTCFVAGAVVKQKT